MGVMESEAVIQRVRALIEPLLAARRVELVELTYRREGPRHVLRLLVDTAAGVTVEELSRLNQAIGALLDEHEALGERYLLEVCSPGLDRPLKTTRDFERVIGRRVWMVIREPIQGVGELVGMVVSVGDEIVTMQLDHGATVRVPLSNVLKAAQEIAFER